MLLGHPPSHTHQDSSGTENSASGCRGERSFPLPSVITSLLSQVLLFPRAAGEHRSLPTRNLHAASALRGQAPSIKEKYFSRSASVCFVLLFGLVVPLLNRIPAVDSAWHVPDYFITLLGKFICYSIVALALDLIWGFCGILSLGQGVFFALGGYAMGMYLMQAAPGEGVYRSQLPDFMVFLNWHEMPWFWRGFEYFSYALLPAVFAFVFGYFAFYRNFSPDITTFTMCHDEAA